MLLFGTPFQICSHTHLMHNSKVIESKSDKLVIMCAFTFSWSLSRMLDPSRAFRVQLGYGVREYMYIHCAGGLLMLHHEAQSLDGDFLI